MGVASLVDRPSVLGVPSVFVALAIISLAAGAHQGWSCNLYTLVSDTLPRRSISMVVGICSGFAAVGAAAFQLLVGRSLELTGGYAIPFFLASTLYLVALGALHLMLPRVEPTTPKRPANMALVWAGGLAMVAFVIGLQFALNKPPFASLNEYLVSRSSPVEGPSAKVGWMSARWYLSKPSKLELVSFDRDGRPVVEAKGASAARYSGPSLGEVRAGFGLR
jgi:ACS family hexuronate transporter-like MFS transporter